MTKTTDDRTKSYARNIAEHFDQISESLGHELRRFIACSDEEQCAAADILNEYLDTWLLLWQAVKELDSEYGEREKQHFLEVAARISEACQQAFCHKGNGKGNTGTPERNGF